MEIRKIAIIVGIIGALFILLWPGCPRAYASESGQNPQQMQIRHDATDDVEPEKTVTGQMANIIRTLIKDTKYLRRGDICIYSFPDYDTGINADWSYQSEDLKVAIIRCRNKKKNQTYYIADVWIRNISQFKTAFAKDKYNNDTNVWNNGIKEESPMLARRKGAIFAVNGSYNIGLCVHDGVVYGEQKNREGAALLYNDGRIVCVNTKQEKIDAEKEVENGLIHAWQFGPVLVHEGKKTTVRAGDEKRAPRTCIGYCEPGHYIFMMCEGRSAASVGMSIDEIRDVMYEMNCVEAMNLDGGWSSCMLLEARLVNKTAYDGEDSNGNKYSHGRPINDLIYFTGCDR